MNNEKKMEKRRKANELRWKIKLQLAENAADNTVKQINEDWALIESVRQLRDDFEYTQREIAKMTKIPRHYVRSIIYRFCLNR
jgi:hypothetical protein